MTAAKKMNRKRQNKILKKRVNELISLLGMSKKQWKDLKVRVEGKAPKIRVAQSRFRVNDKKIKWGRHLQGRKPSLQDQLFILMDLLNTRLENEKMIEELKEEIEKRNEEMENEK